MAPLNPDISGTPLNPAQSDVIPASGEWLWHGNAFRTPPHSQFWQQFKQMEDEAENLLFEHMGENYIYDPFRVHLSVLPYNEQTDALQRRLNDLSGLSELIMNGTGPEMFRSYWTPQGRPERSPAGRYPIAPQEFTTQNIDPRFLILSQGTVRYDKTISQINAERYYMAGNPFKSHVYEHLNNQLRNGLDLSGKGVVFDVETPGLNPKEGIWQLSMRQFESGKYVGDKTFYFDNTRMKLGYIHDQKTGRTRSLLDAVIPQDAQTDYVANMKEFLRAVQDSEWVAGHNVFFDYTMIAQGLKNNPAYQTDQEYRQLADAFEKKFYNEGKIGNVVDTNVLSRMLLSDIPLAPELQGGPRPYHFSLQNILLQTNLLDRLPQDQVQSYLNQGLHYANVDVPLEGELLKALQEHLRALRGDTTARRLEYGNNLTGAQRAQILHSSALGPNIALSSDKQVLQDLRERARTAGFLDQEGNLIKNLTPLDQMVLMQRDLTQTFKPFKTSDDMELALRIGAYDQFAKEWQTPGRLLKSGARIPSLVEWSKIKEELANKGIPLPGMSFLERTVSSLIGEVGGPDMSSEERHIRELFGSDVASLGRFVGEDKPAIIGNQYKIARLPLDYISTWDKFKDSHLFYLSPFQFGDIGNRTNEVGLMYSIPEEAKSSFIQHLRSIPELTHEDNNELLQDLIDAIQNVSGTYGIQVGTLGGLKGGPEVSKVADSLRQIMGIGVDKSDNTPTFWTQIADIATEGGKKPTIYTGGIVMRPEFLTAQERHQMSDQVNQMTQMYRDLLRPQHERSSITENMLSSLNQARRSSPQDFAKLYKRLRRQKALINAAPLVALGLGTMAASVAWYKHHQQTRALDQTMELQPYEQNRNWNSQNRQQAIPYNPTQPPNYMATANVVSSLDYNKIRHNITSPSKYNYLFTGGYNNLS